MRVGGGVDGDREHCEEETEAGEEGRVGVRDALCVCSLAQHPA